MVELGFSKSCESPGKLQKRTHQNSRIYRESPPKRQILGCLSMLWLTRALQFKSERSNPPPQKTQAKGAVHVQLLLQGLILRKKMSRHESSGSMSDINIAHGLNHTMMIDLFGEVSCDDTTCSRWEDDIARRTCLASCGNMSGRKFTRNVSMRQLLERQPPNPDPHPHPNERLLACVSRREPLKRRVDVKTLLEG